MSMSPIAWLLVLYLNGDALPPRAEVFYSKEACEEVRGELTEPIAEVQRKHPEDKARLSCEPVYLKKRQ